MDKYDDLAKRLRARVELSASRERSLDWRAADAIDQLQAECAKLVAENKRLAIEPKDALPLVPADAEAPRPLARALGLQEAADLLNISYSTVFANRRALGFFQVGRQWRVWPEALRETLGQRTKRSNGKPSRIDSNLPVERISRPRPYSSSPSARQAEKELDALLAEKRRNPGAAK